MLGTCFVPLACLYLAGCADGGGVKYDYSGADAAKIRFIESLTGSYIQLFPEHDCNQGVTLISKQELVPRLTHQSVQMLDASSTEGKNFQEYEFKPGTVINLGFLAQALDSCTGGVSFVAKAGIQYEVIHGTKNGRCVMTVNTMQMESGIVTRKTQADTGPLICKG